MAICARKAHERKFVPNEMLYSVVLFKRLIYEFTRVHIQLTHVVLESAKCLYVQLNMEMYTYVICVLSELWTGGINRSRSGYVMWSNCSGILDCVVQLHPVSLQIPSRTQGTRQRVASTCTSWIAWRRSDGQCLFAWTSKFPLTLWTRSKNWTFQPVTPWWWALYFATRVKQQASPAEIVENIGISTPNMIWLPHMKNLFLHMHLGTGSCSCVEGGGVLLVRSGKPCTMMQTRNEANRKKTYMSFHGTKNVSKHWN